MSEFDLDGQTYRVSKLDAFKQLHVSRKIAPVIPKLVPVFVKLSAGGVNALKDDPAGLGEVLGPFADALAAMTVEDSEYLVATCLSVVQRKQGDSWSNVWNASAKVLMFADMDLGTMLPLVVRVIRENLGNFIQGLLSNQSGTTAAPQSTV